MHDTNALPTCISDCSGILGDQQHFDSGIREFVGLDWPSHTFFQDDCAECSIAPVYRCAKEHGYRQLDKRDHGRIRINGPASDSRILLEIAAIPCIIFAHVWLLQKQPVGHRTNHIITGSWDL